VGHEHALPLHKFNSTDFQFDKYLDNMKVNQMDTAEQQDYPSDDDNLETQRAIIRQSLTEIADDIAIAMRDSNLHFPLGIAVPSSGALLTMMTPNDPTDADWSDVSAIVCQVVAAKLDGMRLRSRPLICAMTNASMAVAEITTNTLAFDLRS
jgi:hypothetical protein